MSKRVLIVGAGVMGLCSAHYLSRRGCAVTVIDREDAGFENCSFGNAGLICPSHIVPLAAPGMVGTALRMMFDPASPFYIRPRFDRELFDWMLKFRCAATEQHVARCAPLLRDLNMASRGCYEELANLPGADFGFVRKGLLMLCKTERGLAREAAHAERARSLGMAADVLDPRRIAELEPRTRLEVAGGVLYPADCHLCPGNLMRWLRKQLHEAGVAFLWKTDLTGWRLRDGTIEAARTSAGDLTADAFVLCGGSWSAAAVKEIGLTLPMQPGKGYSVTLASPPQLPTLSMILTEARVAVTPMESNLRFAGTMEIAGFDRTVNPVRMRGIVQSVPAYLPDFGEAHFAAATPWCGLRPCSPDGLPYIGRTRKLRNLYVAAGHATMGLSLGPITGTLISQTVCGEPTSIDIGLLDPDRYAKS